MYTPYDDTGFVAFRAERARPGRRGLRPNTAWCTVCSRTGSSAWRAVPAKESTKLQALGDFSQNRGQTVRA